MPGIVLGGENVHEVTFFNTNLAQRWSRHNQQPHPISSFLFSTWTIPYGFHVPNPDWEPEFYQPFQEAYTVWNVLPTIRIRAPRMLTNPVMVRTQDFLKSVRNGQSWEQTWNIDVGIDVIDDINSDSGVNVIDLVFVGNEFGTNADLGEPIDEKAQLYKTPKGVFIEGLYIREFTNGWAVYNRSGKARKIQLPEKVSGIASGVGNKRWHTIPDLDGEIYLKTNPTNDLKETDAIEAIPAWDVNQDGSVNKTDLRLVITDIGVDVPTTPRADINADGSVTIADLQLVIDNLDNPTTAEAPILGSDLPMAFNAELLRAELNRIGTDTQHFTEAIAFLQYLLANIRPEKTALLTNYPNPFNPETWIPYHLANPSEVTISIYSVRGTLVRQLNLGHQHAGYYTDQSRAAYWDGRNEIGERVASGIYFYQLQADNLSFLRKMVILK